MTTMEVELTDVGKPSLQDHYHQGIVREYNVDKPLRLHGWTDEFVEFILLGILCSMPKEVDGQPKVRKAA